MICYFAVCLYVFIFKAHSFEFCYQLWHGLAFLTEQVCSTLVLFEILLCNQNNGGPIWHIKFEVESPIVARLVVSHKSLIFCWCESIVATKLRSIRVKQNHMVTIPLGAHFVVCERFIWVEVKDEKKKSLFENYDLVIFVRQSYKLVLCRQDVIFYRLAIHLTIEVVELLKPQIRIIH